MQYMKYGFPNGIPTGYLSVQSCCLKGEATKNKFRLDINSPTCAMMNKQRPGFSIPESESMSDFLSGTGNRCSPSSLLIGFRITTIVHHPVSTRRSFVTSSSHCSSFASDLQYKEQHSTLFYTLFILQIQYFALFGHYMTNATPLSIFILELEFFLILTYIKLNLSYLNITK